MALSIKENTEKKILDYFKMAGGFSPEYIIIKHIEIQYPNNAINILLAKYASEEERRKDINNASCEFIGFSMPPGMLESMKEHDDRDCIYKYLQEHIKFLIKKKK